MITKISKLEKLGIYKDFTSSEINDFKQYNLIYGWNGSGKSTLSRLFSSFCGRSLSELYNNFKVSIHIDGNIYTEKQLPIKNDSIAVFNEDFIKENIDWNGTLKSILLLDEINIDEIKIYNSLKKELYGDKNEEGLLKEIEIKEKELLKKQEDLQKILTSVGKNVKNNFRLLDTTDSHYMNYDKRNVSSLIDNQNNPLSEKDLIKKDELDNVIKQARPIKKDIISKKLDLLSIENIQNEIKKTCELISRSVTSKVINELKNNSHLSDWVENGLNLHRNGKRKICAFCGSPISEERLNRLDAHFSNELNNLNSDILSSIDKWNSFRLNTNIDYIDDSIFYDELTEKVKEKNLEYKETANSINSEIDIYIETLKEKQKKPFEKIEIKFDINKIEKALNKTNSAIKAIKNTLTVIMKKQKILKIS